MLSNSPRRIVVMGAGAVGKSALVTQYTKRIFPVNYCPTIQDFYEHHAEFPDNKSLMVEIVDTAGLHQFPAMKEVAMKSGHAFIVVYSVDDRKSFFEANILIDQINIIKEKSEGNVPILLVGNKADVDEKSREVSMAEVQAFTFERSLKFMETSAVYYSDASRVFTTILSEMFNNSQNNLGNNRDSLRGRFVKNFQYLLGKGENGSEQYTDSKPKPPTPTSERRRSSLNLFAYIKRRRSSVNNNSNSLPASTQGSNQ